MVRPNDTETTWEDTLGLIASEPVVWYRLAAVRRRPGEDWQTRVLELVSGGPPPSWESRTWTYPTAFFAADQCAGTDAADWMDNARVSVSNCDAQIGGIRGVSVQWDHQASRAVGWFEPLEWPSWGARLCQPDSPVEPTGPLISADAPSFVTFYTAASYFFWLDRQPMGGSISPVVYYRHQDIGARIDKVEVTPKGVHVEMSGNDLGGLVVELAGDLPGSIRRIVQGPFLSERVAVTFPTEGALPPGAWVVLKSRVDWVDRRFLAYPFARGPEPGVEFHLDPKSKLDAYILGREGPQVEFKSRLPTSEDEKAATMKTVSAFANGQGGSIIFGITDTDHEVVGIPTAVVDRSKDSLTDMVRRWVTPSPAIGFEVIAIEGDGTRVVLEMTVAADSDLHGCGRPSEDPSYYIRHYAITVRARPDEIEGIVQARSSASGAVGPFDFR